MTPVVTSGQAGVFALRSVSSALAERRARSTNVEAKPTTSSASASQGARILGLVTL
jgi:precorrin-3B methylase